MMQTMIFNVLTLSIVFNISFLNANISPKGFVDYPNYYFVETGSYKGDGLSKAVKVSFTEIHSLEIDLECVESCRQQFKDDPRVTLHLGDSGKDLWNVIKDFDKPITFWLDGHLFPADPNGGKNTPLLEELEQIKWHPIKTHTILIDDMQCCGTELFDYLTREDIIRKIKEINPVYIISYITGGGYGEWPNNIMVATVTE